MSRYEYIDSCWTDAAELNPVSKMCAWLLVSTSGFYHWLSRPQSATAARREALTARVEAFFKATGGTYGYRRIHADLAEEGTSPSQPTSWPGNARNSSATNGHKPFPCPGRGSAAGSGPRAAVGTTRHDERTVVVIRIRAPH